MRRGNREIRKMMKSHNFGCEWPKDETCACLKEKEEEKNYKQIDISLRERRNKPRKEEIAQNNLIDTIQSVDWCWKIRKLHAHLPLKAKHKQSPEKKSISIRSCPLNRSFHSKARNEKHFLEMSTMSICVRQSISVQPHFGRVWPRRIDYEFSMCAKMGKITVGHNDARVIHWI